LWAPSPRKEERHYPSSSQYVCFGEAHSGRISLNLVFETFIKNCCGNPYLVKIGHNIEGNLLADQYARFTVADYIKSP
jgi:hypothetical protein